MTANRRTTVLIVSAVVLSMLLLSGIAMAQPTAPTQTTAPATRTIGTMENPAASAAGKVTMADIDSALASGPVFVEFESKECGYCKQQRPISEALAGDYAGKVTFFFVDTAESRDLARTFQVSGVPQINVIAKKTDGGYTYINKDGGTSSSIANSKFVGLTQSDTLKMAIDAAVSARGQ